MPRVTHFEIHAERPERAIDFYQSLFGWQFTKWEGPQDYWFVVTGADEEKGINGGLIRRNGAIYGESVIAYVCSIEVQRIDDYIANVTADGGSIAVPKMPIPGIGWLAYGKDTEGNIFGMMEPDETAGV